MPGAGLNMLAQPSSVWANRRLAVPAPRYWLKVGALALAYYGSAKLGYELSFAGPVAAIVWLPVGVGISALYLGGMRLWPGVLAGDLLANDYMALPLGSALAQTCGNVLEVIVATLILRRFVKSRSALGDMQDLRGVLLAIGAGTALSATVGTASVVLGESIGGRDAMTVWRTWWLGDFAGALVVVPFAIAWAQAPRRLRGHGRAAEAGLLLVALLGLGEAALQSHRPLSYLVFPALTWAGLRFGQRGATLAIALTCGLAVLNTTHYTSPFLYHDIPRSVLNTQLFIVVSALTTLCLAAVVSERRSYADGLSASRARLVEASHAERERIERNLHDGAQQHLTSLAIFLGVAAERVRAAPLEGEALFGEARRQLDAAVAELRELSHGIHPSLLTESGLAAAMQSVARRSTIRMTFLELPRQRLDPVVEATAYYVFAEAVANSQKHAQASSMQVRVRTVGDSLHIAVSDDGIGGADENGPGLRGLRDRVETAGGIFRVESAPGRGTRVFATVPLPQSTDSPGR